VDVPALRVCAWDPRPKTSTLTYLGSARDGIEPAAGFVRILSIVCSRWNFVDPGRQKLRENRGSYQRLGRRSWPCRAGEGRGERTRGQAGSRCKRFSNICYLRMTIVVLTLLKH